MSVYTVVSPEQLQAFLSTYSIGELVEYVGINAGVQNTNYFVTTTQGAFVLTLFEQHTPDELDYFLALMAHWSAAGLPIARPIAHQNGEYLNTLCDKPTVLVTRLQGTHVEQPTREQCAQIGATLAKMHESSRTFTLERTPDRGRIWQAQTAEFVLPHLNSEQAQLLRAEMAAQTTLPLDALPRATLHADLFRDNALLTDDTITGVLDLYFACTDCALYDVAVLVNDWCGNPDGSLDPVRVTACIQAYQAIRPWEPLEQQHWDKMLRMAACRFWLSRLEAKHNPMQGELVLQKDPKEFQLKLEWLYTHVI